MSCFIAQKHNKEEMEREIRKGIYALYFEFFPRKLHNKKRRNGREKSRNTASPNLIATKHPIRKRNGKENRKRLMSWCVIYEQEVK
jgi:hypothetical protein